MRRVPGYPGYSQGLHQEAGALSQGRGDKGDRSERGAVRMKAGIPWKLEEAAHRFFPGSSEECSPVDPFYYFFPFFFLFVAPF